MSGCPLDHARVVACRPDTPAARAVLDELVAVAWTPRADLVGVQGPRAGSGRTDGEFWQHGAWFAKSRAGRRHVDAGAAIAATERLYALKVRLGELTPARTLVVALAAPDEGAQVWTIAPRLQTLRERLDAAAEDARWPEFGLALTAFASGLGETLELSLGAGLGLDANPANFATQGARLRYLDDDVTATRDALGVEDAFVARFVEYPAAPPAVLDAYTRRMVDELRARTSAEIRARLDLDRRFTAAATLRRGTAPHVERLLAWLAAPT